MPTGSSLVITPDMRRLINGMPDALASGSAVVVSGPWGAGKTTLLQALAAVSDVNTVFVEIPPNTNSTSAQWNVLTGAITGQPARGTARQMQVAARDHITAFPTLLVVDEAQHLSTAALHQLRWLWGHNFPQFAVVLAGSQLNERLQKEPAIHTRIDRRILLRAHGSDRMLALLQASDPVLAQTQPDLLHQIDEVYGHGCWRNWSELLRKATRLNHTGPLTYEIAREAILDRTGVLPALTPDGARR